MFRKPRTRRWRRRIWSSLRTAWKSALRSYVTRTTWIRHRALWSRCGIWVAGRAIRADFGTKMRRSISPSRGNRMFFPDFWWKFPHVCLYFRAQLDIVYSLVSKFNPGTNIQYQILQTILRTIYEISPPDSTLSSTPTIPGYSFHSPPHTSPVIIYASHRPSLSHPPDMHTIYTFMYLEIAYRADQLHTASKSLGHRVESLVVEYCMSLFIRAVSGVCFITCYLVTICSIFKSLVRQKGVYASTRRVTAGQEITKRDHREIMIAGSQLLE